MSLYPKNKLSIHDIKKFILIFYIVGIIGFILPYTRNIFIIITPLALILNIYLLAIFHHPYDSKHIIIFISILFVSFFLEVIGVKTGKIFGTYSYGEALGIKILETPILIGFNWLFLTYCSTSFWDHWHTKPFLVIILAPLLMVFYDIALEHIAPTLNMWSWAQNTIPFTNYLHWYLISMIFVILFKIFRLNTNNPLAITLFFTQFAFFIFLNIFFNIIL
jgi:putative membrane protein